ncbi:arylamine N-acetyltransferase family protein [Reichenbachiella ulvae]|uniref:Arylamine N-acetyltransferase n=1 Tax=Reichenbachiella ulvae TaxID=2980104 RepID=A0ABT3CYC9_9BACT|nr:arylamine N-acetyltransferase [Reichenbachiella ulvae]MCV9388627.1 arylamine N-acetyltransferase [Reichenbachiella ulvae]
MSLCSAHSSKPTLPETVIQRYLQRIKSPYERLPSLRYLRLLHRNHMMHVPFENLDIHLGNEIILDAKRVLQKVIIKKRGGFCYELNGIFCLLLKAIGFDAQLISARVYSEGNYGREMDHAAILVHLDHKSYLCDVGFGDSFLSPKVMHVGEVQMDYNLYYRIDKNAEGDYILSRSEDSITFTELYLFTKKERQWIEFIDMCHFHQHNPSSHFTQKKVITIAKPDGRLTLSDEKMTRVQLGQKIETPILNHDEFQVLLHQHFGILYRKSR